MVGTGSRFYSAGVFWGPQELKLEPCFRVGVLFGYFLWFFLVFFMVFRSADARVSQLVDSRQSGQSVGEPTERSVSQSVGQPTERPVSQSVSRSAGSGESVSQSVSRSSSGSGESVSQSVRLPTEPSISRAVDLALHLQTSEYGVPESPNEGACLRYMMNRNRQKRGRV